jgi:hypothetical protein
LCYRGSNTWGSDPGTGEHHKLGEAARIGEVLG